MKRSARVVLALIVLVSAAFLPSRAGSDGSNAILDEAQAGAEYSARFASNTLARVVPREASGAAASQSQLVSHYLLGCADGGALQRFAALSHDAPSGLELDRLQALVADCERRPVSLAEAVSIAITLDQQWPASLGPFPSSTPQGVIARARPELLDDPVAQAIAAAASCQADAALQLEDAPQHPIRLMGVRRSPTAWPAGEDYSAGEYLLEPDGARVRLRRMTVGRFSFHRGIGGKITFTDGC